MKPTTPPANTPQSAAAAVQRAFGRTVARLRRQRGLSQEHFALDAGVDRRYI